MNEHSGHFVLVVDDDAPIREALVTVLRDDGYTAAGAADGREALEFLRNHPPPRVILLDLMMPVMDGWTFLREQAADPLLAAIPVVVITAGSEGAAPALEGRTVLPKPLKIDDVVAAVKRHC
jgi:CheY-like chemotaxis protein